MTARFFFGWLAVGIAIVVVGSYFGIGRRPSVPSPAARQELATLTTALDAPKRASNLTTPAAAFLDDGRLLAVSHTYVIELFDARTPNQGTVVATLAVSPMPVLLGGLVASADGRTIAALDRGNGKLHIWELPSAPSGHLEAQKTLTIQQVGAFYDLDISLAPDGRRVAASVTGGGVHVWRTDEPAAEHVIDTQTRDASSVAFSPDGQILATGTTRRLDIWDVDDGALIRTVSEGASGISSLAFSPDGATVVAGSTDKTILAWRVANAEIIRTFAGHTSTVSNIVVSPDGTTLASTSADRSVRLWRLTDGALLHTLSEHEGHPSGLAFSPDGQTLATVVAQHSETRPYWAVVRYWRVADGSPLGRFSR